ncbi:tetraacyldisaccharide 4'-kinase [Arenimonas composti]|uniref:Tetraacyldisaccharide 4'-kinase n=1 Tax=Arenimonas composti TR7-09 = DSM 18010 TaxID=1121013 RepID=A0A091B3J4_9GAMM|nr:tetraacyldisaccharide 4'-kinase [Arenimonas composti]KFN46291.1 hypothetical protein P873_01910 [Arenimonas composti TR7-09 = DSM 18010]
MSAALEAWLLRRWYGGVAPGPGLRALAALHGTLLRLRTWLRRRGWPAVQSLPVPVVVVGNLIAGGAGKTPLTIAVAGHLAAAGWKPGIVSRGHGRRSRGPVRVHPDTPASEAGDEPLLIARRTGLPVAVDSDRVAAARRLISEGCDLILADDGLQHLRLGRDIEIEVVDGVRGYGNGRLIPAGPLREPRGRRVDLRVRNGGDGDFAGAGAAPAPWPMTLELADAERLVGGEIRPLAGFAGRRVFALAGIAHPPRFFAALAAAGLAVDGRGFPDHHAFAATDLDFADGAPLLVTEKDAVKLRGLAGVTADLWVVPARAKLPDGFFAALDRLLAERSASHVPA